MRGEGYCQWPRLKETIGIFVKKMGYKKDGTGILRGLRKEAYCSGSINGSGFDVVSVICKTGGFPKESVGIQRKEGRNADAFEPMCNPLPRQIF